MISHYDHFCDYQIRRFLTQLVRAFSGFQYMTGRRGDISPQLKIVPCTTAKRNRQVATIQQNLSENTLNTVPMITVDQTNFRFDAERLQNPGHIGKVQVYERAIDPQTGLMTANLGNSITVERLMPLPFTMEFQVDIWTSNLDQKHQLMEQILTTIFPTFSIQNSDNPLDWSALTDVHCKDITWSSVSIPIGTGNEIDIATITGEIPMWLTPPAKQKRMKVIEQIITNINDASIDDRGNIVNGERLSQDVVTPGNYHVEIDGGFVKLLGAKANEIDPDGDLFDWQEMFDVYGHPFIPAQSQMRVRYAIEDGSPEIIGKLQATSEPNVLSWQIDPDTLPANTLRPINAVIHPTKSRPGAGLPVAAGGQRYLLASDLPAIEPAWDNLGARENAIIEHREGQWRVVFEGTPAPRIEYVLNANKASQLRWNGEIWTLAIDGVHAPGYWRII